MAVSKQWQMIRSWLRKTYNKEVYEFFRDFPEEDPDNSTPRSTSKAVCLIGPDDSQGIAAVKRQNFEWLKERAGLKQESAHEFDYLPEDSPRNKPQVQLWFQEKKSIAYSDGRNWARRARISFRIKEDWKQANDANSTALKIKNILVSPLFHFTTGKYCATYRDPKKGYRFTLFVASEAEARRVLEKIFQVIEETPNWKNLRISEQSEPEGTKKVQILGKQVTQFDSAKQHEVYFRYAVAKIDPYPKAFPLVDVSGKFVNAIYRAN